MRSPTQKDVFEHLFGSGATVYSWYRETIYKNKAAKDAWGSGLDVNIDGWEFVMNMENPEAGGVLPITFNHDMLMNALKTIADLSIPIKFMPSATRREVQVLLSEPDHADFDANDADCVLQFAAYGRIHFG